MSTAVLDKTGTLTDGKANIVDIRREADRRGQQQLRARPRRLRRSAHSPRLLSDEVMTVAVAVDVMLGGVIVLEDPVRSDAHSLLSDLRTKGQ